MRNSTLVPRAAVLAALMTCLLVLGPSGAQAAPKPKTNSISLVPTISSINLVNGQLVAAGTVNAVVHGTTTTVPFSGVPVNLGLAADQSGAAAAGCPILDLSLAPINLNLLGLQVQTSPICLTITAYQGGGLLGDLLCNIANALGGGTPLGTILAGLDLAGTLNGLLGNLTSLLNGALQQLSQAVLTSIQAVNQGHTCSILHLALGPVDLTLLGLNVHLDNCANGPVTVDITAITGRGNLLGNLLCELLDGSLINLTTTLQQILNQITGLLSQ